MGIILLSYLPALIGMFIIALFVFMRQRRPAYIIFAVTLFIVTLWLGAQLVSFFVSGWLMLWATRVSLSAFNFITPSFFLFTLLYPTTKHWLGRRKIFLIYFLPIVMAFLSFSSALVANVERRDYDLILQTGFLYDVQSIMAIIYVIAALSVLVWKYRHENRKDRVAVLMLFVAFLFPLIVGVFANYLWINIPGTQYLLPITLFVTFLIIAYAMIKHKLFDIRLVVARAVGYVLLLTALMLIYAGAILAVTQFFFGDTPGVSNAQSAVYFVFAVLLAFTFNPLKSFFDKITNSIFYRRDYDPQEILGIVGDITSNEIDLKKLSGDIIKVLQAALKPEFVNLHIKVQYDQSERKFFAGRSVETFSEQLIHKINDYDKKVILTDYIEDSHERLQVMLNKLGIGVVVRLDTSREHVGYLLLGVKRSGNIYDSKDDQFFRSIGNELALALQNSLRFEEIQGFNETLQDKIESATGRLRNTNRKLRQLDIAKDEFVSMASHQLRTPLTSVKGYLSMVLEGDAGKLNSAQEKLLKEAFTSSERMVHLIGDFLNVSRLQTGKFILESRAVDLAKVVGQEVDSLQTTAKAHNMKLEYRAPSYFPTLYIDEGKIRQVLMNFMDNSIYYSREHTTISVKLAVEEGYAVATVHDTGIGVPKSEQAHLFTKFFRATNARRQRPDGTGVGLFLAKKVIVAHGGSMVFESVEGEGSTFGFRLPIKKLSVAPKTD